MIRPIQLDKEKPQSYLTIFVPSTNDVARERMKRTSNNEPAAAAAAAANLGENLRGRGAAFGKERLQSLIRYASGLQQSSFSQSPKYDFFNLPVVEQSK